MSEGGYGIDSHKLVYHVGRVNDWLEGRDIYPIYIEAAPAGGCNQRCIFCGLDYTSHKARFMDVTSWKRFVKIASKKGLKSVLLSGEGEPFLHPEISEFSISAGKEGVDAAIATNGFLMTEDVSGKVLPALSWLRVSLDAATDKTYSLIHGVRKECFGTVLENLAKAVKIKKKNGYKVTIGAQFLLLNENIKEVKKAAVIARDTGLDYFSVKPYSKHPLSINEAGTEVDYEGLLRLEKQLEKFSDDGFSVIFRKSAIKRKLREKSYRRCLGLPFWAYINSAGDVYPCSTFLGLKKYCIGNITREKFSDIWEGGKRERVMKVLGGMDARKCRELCRLDEINTYLWKLKNPPAHVNFI
ncbi:MAG: radical SAM protein [Candidatus Omnitrophota bacterium]